MQGVDKLFLLNAVEAEELTQSLIAVATAKRKGLRHVTYQSELQVDRFPDVPHFAAKQAVETALRDSDVPQSILRPGYYFQNETWVKDSITKGGIYPMPIGTAGIAAIDVRDIAESAAVTLTTEGHDGHVYDLTSSELITGPGNAATWGKLLGRGVQYGGQDFDGFETYLRSYLPAWNAFDVRKMFQGFFERGLTTNWNARLDLYQWMRETLDKESKMARGMVRNYAFTCVAISLRVISPLSAVADISFRSAYRVMHGLVGS